MRMTAIMGILFVQSTHSATGHRGEQNVPLAGANNIGKSDEKVAANKNCLSYIFVHLLLIQKNLVNLVRELSKQGKNLQVTIPSGKKTTNGLIVRRKYQNRKGKAGGIELGSII